MTVVDEPGGRPVVERRLSYRGLVWDVVTETVRMPDGELVVRDVIEHPSAVAVLSLDEDDRALVVHQYRHAARSTLWELPAGLLDVEGEDPHAAAVRELWEETHHEATRWWVLVDFLSSPGFCDEALRIYLARDVSRSVGAEHDRHGEERDMGVAWVPLDELLAGVLAGRLHNPTLVVGVLAAGAARAEGWRSLRPTDSAWDLGPRALRQPG